MISILIHTVGFDEVCCSVIHNVGFLFCMCVQNNACITSNCAFCRGMYHFFFSC